MEIYIYIYIYIVKEDSICISHLSNIQHLAIIYIYIYTYIYIYISSHLWAAQWIKVLDVMWHIIYTYMYIHITYIYILHIYIYDYIYIYIYIYIYMYIGLGILNQYYFCQNSEFRIYNRNLIT